MRKATKLELIRGHQVILQVEMDRWTLLAHREGLPVANALTGGEKYNESYKFSFVYCFWGYGGLENPPLPRYSWHAKVIRISYLKGTYVM